MARMACRCGMTLSNSTNPEIEYSLYSYEEWNSILGTDTIETWMIPDSKYSIWRCPKCERIYVFEGENIRAVKIYVLEE